MDISRVEFFCPDKKVGEVLRLLTGIALDIPKVTPVANARKGRNGLEQQTNGDAVEMFAQYIKKHRLTEVNSDIGREFCKSIGRSSEGYNNLFSQAKKRGLLRRVGKTYGAKWRVVK
jgi:hypothetical protein